MTKMEKLSYVSDFQIMPHTIMPNKNMIIRESTNNALSVAMAYAKSYKTALAQVSETMEDGIMYVNRTDVHTQIGTACLDLILYDADKVEEQAELIVKSAAMHRADILVLDVEEELREKFRDIFSTYSAFLEVVFAV